MSQHFILILSDTTASRRKQIDDLLDSIIIDEIELVDKALALVRETKMSMEKERRNCRCLLDTIHSMRLLIKNAEQEAKQMDSTIQKLIWHQDTRMRLMDQLLIEERTINNDL